MEPRPDPFELLRDQNPLTPEDAALLRLRHRSPEEIAGGERARMLRRWWYLWLTITAVVILLVVTALVRA